MTDPASDAITMGESTLTQGVSESEDESHPCHPFQPSLYGEFAQQDQLTEESSLRANQNGNGVHITVDSLREAISAATVTPDGMDTRVTFQSLVDLLKHMGAAHPPEEENGLAEEHRVLLAIIAEMMSGLDVKSLPIKVYRELFNFQRRFEAVLQGETIEISEPPVAFGRGSVSHAILGRMPATVSQLGRLPAPSYDGTRFCFAIHDADEANGMYPGLRQRPLFPTERDEETGSRVVLETLYDLVPPTSEKTALCWMAHVIRSSFAELTREGWTIPLTVAEVSQLLEDPVHRASMMRIIEIMHVASWNENRGQLNLSITGESGAIRIDILSQESNAVALSVLDWLALAQQFIVLEALERENSSRFRSRIDGVRELRMGTVEFCGGCQEEAFTEGDLSDTLPLAGGNADMVYVGTRLEGDLFDISRYEEMEERLRAAASNFDRDAQRDRLVAVQSHSGESTLRRRRKGRTFGTLLESLLRAGGIGALHHTRIDIEDFKFIVGDGGGNRPIDRRNGFRADPSHVRQMERYLFFAAAQLAMVHAHVEKGPQCQQIAVDEVVAVARKYDFQNITGLLRYFFPDGEFSFVVECSEGMLRSTGETLMKRLQRDLDLRKAYGLVRVLRSQLGGKLR
jgi:hypothetical protein